MKDRISPIEMTERYPGTTVQTWAVRRHRGGGPRYLKLGRKIFYRIADLEAWENENQFERTDQPVEPGAA